MYSLVKKEQRFIFIWGLTLIGFYTLFTVVASTKVYKDKSEANAHHDARLDPYQQEADYTWIHPDSLIEDASNPAAKVTCGIYLDHIVDLSTKNTNWTVDFYIWFLWSDTTLHPGKNFHVLGGEILSRELIKSTEADGGQYALYHVNAMITKFFNVTRYPRDDHMLTISIENKYYPWHRLQYIPDVQSSIASSRGRIPGYVIDDSISIAVKAHPYKTSRADPDIHKLDVAVYDQLIFGINIQRNDWGLFFKMFLFLFASVAVAFLVFFMKPDADRIGLGVGAFFSAVASSYITTAELPGAGIITLCDLINILGMLTVFLTIMSSVVIKHYAVTKNNVPLSKVINRISIWIFAFGYIIANIVVATLASA